MTQYVKCEHCRQQVLPILSRKGVKIADIDRVRVFLVLNDPKPDTTLVLSDGGVRVGRECHVSTPNSSAVEGYYLHRCPR